jgi:MFS family permease
MTVRWPQYAAGLAAAGGALSMGSGLGWSAPAGPRLVNEGQYFPITASQFDWVASIITLGCAISCLPVGFLMKKFGRKWTMLSLVVPFLIGWALVTWAQNFTMLLIGRFFIGLAGGAFCVSAPQYSAEIAQKEIRGTIGSFFQLLVITGILFVYLIGPFMTLFWTNIMCGMIPIVFAAIFFFMPESPVYLVIENREEEAIKSYKWLRGSSYDPKTEIDALKQDLLDSQNTKVSLKEEFRKRSSILGIVISVGLMFFQQMSGINVVVFYATIIFDVN